MDVKKQPGCVMEHQISQEDMDLINSLAKTTLTPEQVYTFAVRLCDNEVDRDWERFDIPALSILSQLFVGKSGIFDHNWSAEGQTARIYRTELVEEPGVVTEAGEPGCYLKGYAYMLRTAENAGLIAEIEGGIKKEVSVSCAVRRQVCSICGHDIHDRGQCSHGKGQVYGEKRCIVRLAEPTDAFEWSFVAVPAQPRAGVVKGFQPGKEAAAGRRHLEDLRRETVRLGLLAEPALGEATLQGIAGKLNQEELEALQACYARRLEGQLPLPVQLHYGGETTQEGAERDRSFVI